MSSPDDEEPACVESPLQEFISIAAPHTARESAKNDLEWGCADGYGMFIMDEARFQFGSGCGTADGDGQFSVYGNGWGRGSAIGEGSVAGEWTDRGFADERQRQGICDESNSGDE